MCVSTVIKLRAVWACIRALDTARDAAATRCIRDPAQAVPVIKNTYFEVDGGTPLKGKFPLM